MDFHIDHRRQAVFLFRNDADEMKRLRLSRASHRKEMVSPHQYALALRFVPVIAEPMVDEILAFRGFDVNKFIVFFLIYLLPIDLSLVMGYIQSFYFILTCKPFVMPNDSRIFQYGQDEDDCDAQAQVYELSFHADPLPCSRRSVKLHPEIVHMVRFVLLTGDLPLVTFKYNQSPGRVKNPVRVIFIVMLLEPFHTFDPRFQIMIGFQRGIVQFVSVLIVNSQMVHAGSPHLGLSILLYRFLDTSVEFGKGKHSNIAAGSYYLEGKTG